MKITGKKNTERIVTLMGVFQCMALILPLGFYKIEPPSNHVGTLWGFLKAPTYLTFIAGILIIFRYQIQNHTCVKVDLMIILLGILILTTFFLGGLLAPITQQLIEGFDQVTTHSGSITYLDVVTGGLFDYILFGMGLLYIGLGIEMHNHDSPDALDLEKKPF